MADSENLEDEARARFPDELLSWFEENGRSFHWRRDDISPYQMLVAEVFLQVTRAEVVEPVYEEFLERFPTPAALRDAERVEIIDVIRPIGVYNRRADALSVIARELDENGVPETRDELLELPQVGDYAANATLCFGENRPLPVVDSNIERIYDRLLGELEVDVWEVAGEMIPDDRARDYNLALLDFGSEVCSHHNPSCESCFASEYCDFYSSSTDDST